MTGTWSGRSPWREPTQWHEPRPQVDGTGLRIAQLANFVGPVSGGMRQALSQIGAGYCAAGAERILVIPGEEDKVEETCDGTIVHIRAPRIGNNYRMIAFPQKALRVLEQFQPTSVEVSDKWTLSRAGSWARKRDVGSVLFSHERLTDMLANWLQRQVGVTEIVGALNRRLAKEFDVVVTTSRYAAEEFENTGARMELVPLGVDLQVFNPSVAHPPAAGEGPLQLCHVGRMSREKDPQLAIRTAVELHRRGVPIQMHVYGTGADLDWLKEIAGDAPVEFHGYVDGRAKVAEAFGRAHISLSVSPNETFGLAVLEALATGTPVVTANRGGAHELVEATCGDWADPDPVLLADAVEGLAGRLAVPGGQEVVRAAARERAEKFTWSATVERLLTIHRSLAEKYGS